MHRAGGVISRYSTRQAEQQEAPKVVTEEERRAALAVSGEEAYLRRGRCVYCVISQALFRSCAGCGQRLLQSPPIQSRWPRSRHLHLRGGFRPPPR